MTDKELIKQEIERQIKEGKFKCRQSQEDNDYESFIAWSEHIATCDKILLFIDSLPEEPVNEDLEEASWNYSDRDGIGYGQRYAMQIDFKAGARWQKHQIKELLQTEYEKGRFDMREEMMKDALETNLYLDGNFLTVDYDFSEQGYQECDRIKFVIIKEE